MSVESLGVWVLAFLNSHAAIVFFLVLGIGYLIGNIRIGSSEDHKNIVTNSNLQMNLL